MVQLLIQQLAEDAPGPNREVLHFIEFIVSTCKEVCLENDWLVEQVFIKLGPCDMFLAWLVELLEPPLGFCTRVLLTDERVPQFAKLTREGIHALFKLFLFLNRQAQRVTYRATDESRALFEKAWICECPSKDLLNLSFFYRLLETELGAKKEVVV